MNPDLSALMFGLTEFGFNEMGVSLQFPKQTTSSLSFFLVRRAKPTRHANDHACDWRRETGEAS